MSRLNLEAVHQKMLVGWFRVQYPELILFAIPNGGTRAIREAKSLVAGGVKAGVPDLMLACAKGGYNGLFIEMKRPKIKGKANPVVSKEQKEVIRQLNQACYLAEVCYGFEEAMTLIKDYLSW